MECPLLHITPNYDESDGECLGEACAWWIKGESRPGGCCIPRLAHYTAALTTSAKRIAEASESAPAEAAAAFAAMVKDALRSAPPGR
jgi:hypothetical protein